MIKVLEKAIGIEFDFRKPSGYIKVFFAAAGVSFIAHAIGNLFN